MNVLNWGKVIVIYVSEVNFCKVGAHSSFSLPNNQDARKSLRKKSQETSSQGRKKFVVDAIFFFAGNIVLIFKFCTFILFFKFYDDTFHQLRLSRDKSTLVIPDFAGSCNYILRNSSAFREFPCELIVLVPNMNLLQSLLGLCRISTSELLRTLNADLGSYLHNWTSINHRRTLRIITHRFLRILLRMFFELHVKSPRSNYVVRMAHWKELVYKKIRI